MLTLSLSTAVRWRMNVCGGRLQVLIFLSGFLCVAVGTLGASPGIAASDRLPDLGMAQLSDIQIQKTPQGTRLLRYSSTIVNVGAGPFEALGQRADTSTPTMSVTQRIFDDAGGFRDLSTGATMYYAGDGHNHWHLRDLESGELVRLDNGVKSGTSAKHGFCFFDNVAYRLSLPRAPQSASYTDCGGGNPDLLAVTMGLSVGWGDIYSWDTVSQYVDITALTPGRYRLYVTADASNWFVESNDSNNTTWADIELRGKGTGIKVLAYGPGA
jgi:hypothetical protein